MIQIGTTDLYDGVSNWQHIYWIVDRLYQQMFSIHVGTNCAPLLGDLFSFHYGHMSLQENQRSHIFFHIQINWWCSFNLQYKLFWFVYVYPLELEYNETTDTASSA